MRNGKIIYLTLNYFQQVIYLSLPLPLFFFSFLSPSPYPFLYLPPLSFFLSSSLHLLFPKLLRKVEG